MKYYCPRCHSLLTRSESFNGGYCKTWHECPKCNTFLHTYRPLPHQIAVHTDKHRLIGNFGGYGTGKTTTSREEVIKHCIITPGALVVIGAGVQRQYEQTIKRELESDIPAKFVKHYSSQKQTMDLINGSRILWTPFDDPDKLRSMNITMFVILEASEVKGETYAQLNTRFRNLAASVPKRDAEGNIVYKMLPNGDEVEVLEFDWRRGIIESNPDAGWIKNEILMRSHRIYQHGTYHEYVQDEERIVPELSSHVAATHVNPYLPAGWEEDLRRKNPKWWQLRYLDGSFQYSEGLVYPSAMNNVVPQFEVPRNWLRMVAFDYGIADTAAFVFVAIDEMNGQAFVYKDPNATNRSVEQLAKMYHLNAADIPVGGLYRQPIIDPKSGPKRGTNLRTLSDEFLDYGINFQPGHVNVDARIFRLNTWFESGKLKIMDNCTFLIEELQQYRFKEKTLSDTDRTISKPMDKNNHAINALEWIVMELPHDPRSLANTLVERNRNQSAITPLDEYERSLPTPWQFGDEEDDSSEKRGMRKWW